jgi:hypothetical protein
MVWAVGFNGCNLIFFQKIVEFLSFNLSRLDSIGFVKEDLAMGAKRAVGNTAIQGIFRKDLAKGDALQTPVGID